MKRHDWVGSVVVGVCALAAVVPAGVARGDVPAARLELQAHIEYDGSTNVAFGERLAVTGAISPSSRGDDGDSGVRLFNTGRAGFPKELAFASCPGYQSTVGVVGTTVVQALDVAEGREGCPLAPESRSAADEDQGIRLWDASDPANPKPVGFVRTVHGVHTFTIVPTGDGRTLLYTNNQAPFAIIDITDPRRAFAVDYYDMADVPSVAHPTVPERRLPEDRRVVTNATTPRVAGGSIGCHEIGLDQRRPRAFCAGLTETQIWDISDPIEPRVTHIIKNPLMNHHHSAEIAPDGRTLVLTDEGGVGAGGPIDCLVPGAPTGALWFYDLAPLDDDDPLNDQLHPSSWWAPPLPEPFTYACNAHNFDFLPGDRPLLVAAWQGAGIFVLDYSRRDRIALVAEAHVDGASFWDAKVHRGHIYASSTAPFIPIGGAPASVVGEFTSPDRLLRSPTGERQGGLYVFRLRGYTPGTSGTLDDLTPLPNSPAPRTQQTTTGPVPFTCIINR